MPMQWNLWNSLKQRTLFEWGAVTLGLLLMAGLATAQGWLWRADQAIYDAAVSWRRPPVPKELLIVAIDEESLQQIGRWPWPRSAHAALLDRLTEAGVAAVALDIILTEPGRGDEKSDAVLADAIRRNGRVVLPILQQPIGQEGLREQLPDPRFASVAAGLGLINVELDPDGFVRSAYLWEGSGQPFHPQLALALLAQVDPSVLLRYPRPAADPGAADGWWRSRWFRFPFAGPPGTIPTVSYAEVLRGGVPAERLRGAVVLVGATAIGLGDAYPTPVSGFGRLMPGVEVLGNLYGALKDGAEVRVLPRLWSGMLTGCGILLLMAFLLKRSPRQGLIASTLLLGLACLACIGLVVQWGIWWPPSVAIAGGLLAYPLWSWRRLEAAQVFTDAELSQLNAEPALLHASPRVRQAGSMDPMQRRLQLIREAVARQQVARRFIGDVLEALQVGVLVADRDGRIVLSNAQARALLGAEEHPVIALAQAAAELRPVGSSGPFVDLGRIAEIALPVSFEADARGGRTLFVAVAELMDPPGGSAGFIVSLDDISDIRAAQLAREETIRFLSHDLRAPLASMVTLLDAARGNPAMLEGERLAQMSRRAAGALELADGMLRLARAEAIDPGRFVEVSLEQVALDAADEVWPLAERRRVKVQCRMPDEGEPYVRGDGGLLRRAIINLLVNAVGHSPEGGQVALRVELEEGDWVVSVADQGAGVPAELLGKLFHRFHRLESASRQPGSGAGLGLVIVRTIVERHGGRVEVKSTPGKGAVFKLLLPPWES